MTNLRIPDDRLADLTAFRRALHQTPETGFEVQETARRIAGRLRALGLEVTNGVGRTGIVASLRFGDSGRAIGLRADMDALSITEANEFEHRSTVVGKFHGCGHDGHSTSVGSCDCQKTSLKRIYSLNLCFAWGTEQSPRAGL